MVRVLGQEAALARSPLARLDARLETLRELRGPAVAGFCSRVRDLVLIASSSRGGSSMFSETLRRSDRMLHLHAEVNPFLRLIELGFPESGTDSDRLDARHWHGLELGLKHRFDRDLALDAGWPLDAIEDEDQFLLDAAWRFAVQWPAIDFSISSWVEIARRVLSRSADMRSFQLRLLACLAENGFPVSPHDYDLPSSSSSSGTPGAVVERELMIEEPPFILPRPWRRAAAVDLETKPLVIKTPSNAYRLPFYRAAFPNARIRIIHLVRNPAASINGLFDGWRHRGFHAHRMSEPLRISGYSDVRPADARWWKFDLPPGWRDYTSRSLLEVCAFQWRSTHEAILSARAATHRADYLCVRFEDLIRTPESRASTFRAVSEWLGVPFDGGLERSACEGVEPVVATAAPRANRWRDRGPALESVLDRRVRGVAEELGYAGEQDWI